jgi:hypothetical protein
VSELVEWLRAQLDEDERVARGATGGAWEVGPTFGGHDSRVYVRAEGDLIDSIGTCVITGQIPNVPQWRGNAQHIARWDPDRVLAEVEAKRRLVDLHPTRNSLRWPGVEDIEVEICETCSRDGLSDEVEAPCPTIRALALPYADRPGYREEWRP